MMPDYRISLVKILHLRSFHVKAETQIALKMNDNIQFLMLFRVANSMSRHNLRNPEFFSVINCAVISD